VKEEILEKAENLPEKVDESMNVQDIEKNYEVKIEEELKAV